MWQVQVRPHHVENGLLHNSAREIAQEAKAEFEERYRYHDRTVRVSPYDGGYAVCEACGKRVEPERSRGMMFSEEPTLSAMQSFRPSEDATKQMTDLQRGYFIMYLIGLLERRCECYYDEKRDEIHPPSMYSQ